jgi:DNA-binding MarR family transcriptional regulator
LTGILQRLGERGLVVRRADPADARRVLLELTARGREVDALRSGTVEVAVRRALRRLSPAAARTVREAAEALSAELSKLGG